MRNGGGRGNRRGNGRSGGGGRSRGGGGGGGRNNNRGGRRRGGRGHPRMSAESGNKRERIAVESGALVCIDQFMLANPQFIDSLKGIVDEEPKAKNDLVQRYGGCVIELEPGTYRIDRDPFACSIVIHPEGETVDSKALSKDGAKVIGNVLIDTRCVAMVDRELLDDAGLLEKYQQLWFSGQDKACRDLVRDNGGAVRYGFDRQGDDLGVYAIDGADVVCLWPENMPAQSSAENIPENLEVEQPAA